MSIDIASIEHAANRIKPYVHRTPVHTSKLLDELSGSYLFFKCENLQRAGAFKARGAHNAVFSLSEEEAQHGVITHSSGNHAGALALAAKNRGIKAFVVMPETAPSVKVAAVRAYGGDITFCKPTLEARESTLQELQKKYHATEIHPYNNELIIAGQATCAREFLQHTPQLDYLIAPVGGGGLLSGSALSTHFLSPNTRVIGAEPKGADDAFQSFTSGRFVPSTNPRTIADGLLTSLGTLTFPVIQKNVAEIITVDEKTIIKAMRLVWERMKLIIEPSSAVPLAAVLENAEKFRGKRIGIIFSGGNVDLDTLPWNKKSPA